MFQYAKWNKPDGKGQIPYDLSGPFKKEKKRESTPKF